MLGDFVLSPFSLTSSDLYRLYVYLFVPPKVPLIQLSSLPIKNLKI